MTKELYSKKADKGSTTVIMSREDKMNEGQVLLYDINNYRHLEKPVVEIIAMKINQLIKLLLQGNHIAEMMAKGLSLTPNPPRIPVFCKPVRRPIISGCVGPTERFSSFVVQLIQPWFFTMFQFPVIKPFGLENWAIFCCCCCCMKIFAYKMHPKIRTDLEQTSQFSLKNYWAL